ncbi:glycosyl transferase [Parafrankia soli]|uniref:Glycosyl transferase n=2 Tax=Parafrankia soli TaxID=2599596 RepID=A0A1S1R1K9_9ACTN|nr:glycosyltransferase [Parafrankia soli]OHV39776.1 glycosyl transferase [Parafrankia soli]
MQNLLAVVVSYGGSAHLYGLLATLTAVPGCQVVLMENHVGTRHTRLPDGVRLHQGHGNVGYGTAVNLGVRLHLDDHQPPDWVLVVNSDVVLPADTGDMLPKLLGEAPDDAGAVGFPIRTGDGRPGRESSVLPSPRTNAFMTMRGEAAAEARWPELRYPVGAFFAIRAAAFLRLGGFDPSYWMYYEETDLFCRLRSMGGRIVWADEAWHVVHDGGATTGSSPLFHWELGRSAAIYFRRHRDTLGLSWPGVHAAQLGVLAARKLVTGRPAATARALRILRGLVAGLARPEWEPPHRSVWRVVPTVTRTRIGLLSSGAAQGCVESIR